MAGEGFLRAGEMIKLSAPERESTEHFYRSTDALQQFPRASSVFFSLRRHEHPQSKILAADGRFRLNRIRVCNDQIALDAINQLFYHNINQELQINDFCLSNPVKLKKKTYLSNLYSFFGTVTSNFTFHIAK